MVRVMAAILLVLAASTHTTAQTRPSRSAFFPKIRTVLPLSQAQHGTPSSKLSASRTAVHVYNDFGTAVANSVQALMSLGTHWRTVVSTGDGTIARENTLTDRTATANRSLLANHCDDIWDSDPPLNITKTGAVIDDGSLVWTGSDPQGRFPSLSEVGHTSLTSVRVGNPFQLAAHG